MSILYFIKGWLCKQAHVYVKVVGGWSVSKTIRKASWRGQHKCDRLISNHATTQLNSEQSVTWAGISTRRHLTIVLMGVWGGGHACNEKWIQSDLRLCTLQEVIKEAEAWSDSLRWASGHIDRKWTTTILFVHFATMQFRRVTVKSSIETAGNWNPLRK